MIYIPRGKRSNTYGITALLMIGAGTALVIIVPTFGQHYGSFLTGIGGWLGLMLGANTWAKWAPNATAEEPAAKPPAKKAEPLGELRG